MKTLRQALKEAEKKKVAIGHFNIADLAGLKAIVEAVRQLRVPVIIGTSEGEAKFLGRKEIVAYIRALRDELKLPLYINSDHTYSFEEVKRAVAAGYDAILFDGGSLPIKENLKQTKKIVSYVRAKDKRIVIEGELGNIGSGSEIRTEIPKEAAIKLEDLTKPTDAVAFVRATGVDMLAPAVGNIHGMLAHAANPALNIGRIREIKEALRKDLKKDVPMVLHGGSGSADSDFSAAIEAGMNIIHISTELRLAWRKGLERSLEAYPDQIAPYKLFPPVIESVKAVVVRRLQLFNKLV
ncbi:MAG: class II fructose-bisphosphate aldolase [Patescibacteria group bacterium]|nr:class II fructose-bisphosphate aldolase [Patescibacteria group bacterium]